ncbi:MAG: undecaprenyl-diphosphate phosphatase [Pseudomonadota bacterium]
MDFIQILALGLIQGITEFLPVSSSGHLVLTSILLGWKDQGLLIDVAAHAGSLLAVMFYFRKQLHEMLLAILNPRNPENSQTLNLIRSIAIATLPIMLTGLLFAGFIESHLRSVQVIAGTTIIFALFLAYADKRAKCERDEYQLSWKAVLFIGMAQAFALIPGTSRSGVTMTAGLLLGLNRVAAARFSFLLSIPTILAAILYKLFQISMTEVQFDWMAIISIFLISGFVAYLCIEVFIRFVNAIGMMPFVVYRIILGILLFVFIGF